MRSYLSTEFHWAYAVLGKAEQGPSPEGLLAGSDTTTKSELISPTYQIYPSSPVDPSGALSPGLSWPGCLQGRCLAASGSQMFALMPLGTAPVRRAMCREHLWSWLSPFWGLCPLVYPECAVTCRD